VLTIVDLGIAVMFGETPSFTQTPTLSFGATQASPQKARRQEEKQSCIPVTVRMVDTGVKNSSMDGGEVRIHGEETSMVVLVGQVESLVRQAASMEFTLNDSSGRIKARHFFPNSEPRPELERLQSGSYVSVVANVRTAPTLHLGVQFMTIVETADEISYHMIESAHAALKLQKHSMEPLTPAPKRPVASPQFDSQPPVWSPTATPPKVSNQSVSTVIPVPMIVTPSKGKMEGDALKNAILEYLRKEGPNVGEAGVGVTAVAAGLEPTPLADIKGCLGVLVEDGDVYTTLDDDHFLTV